MRAKEKNDPYQIFAKSGVAEIFSILIALTVTVNYYSCAEAGQTLHELCSIKNRPMNTLDENESRLLNINSILDTQNSALPRLKNRCYLQYKTCASCHFEIIIQRMNIPCSRQECVCGYFEIKDQLAHHQKRYCGNHNQTAVYFESKTRHINLDFLQVSDVFYIEVNITSQRNIYTFTGTPGSKNFVESPDFPHEYPSDYSAEYIFQSLDHRGQVQLLFLDFLLFGNSYIEISGHRGYRVDTYPGNMFRPPPITSEGTQLRMKFEAATGGMLSTAGFRAVCTFVRSDWGIFEETPNTACGGKDFRYGGTISVNNSAEAKQLVDCIWLVYPPFLSHGSLFSATIAESKNIGIGSSLEFRKGLTSVSSAIEELKCQPHSCPIVANKLEVAASASVGVYIRFRGHITQDTSLIISYSIFNQEDCNSGDFVCENRRCIKPYLHCDGFNHCIDNSDEQKCEVETVRLTTSRSITYVKPKGNPTNQLHAGIISLIVLTGISGLFIIVLGFFLSIKWYKARHVRRESRQGPLILDFGDEAITHRSFERADNPPSYEDVMKFSGRYSRPCYTFQNDAETSCNFSDFRQASNETLRNANENPVSGCALQASELPFKKYTNRCENRVSSVNIPAASQLGSSPGPHSLKHTSYESPKFSERLCKSLDSQLNHCCCQMPHTCSEIGNIKPKYLVLKSVPHKNVRCMTLPPDYKLPQGGESGPSNSECVPAVDVNFASPRDERNGSYLPQYTCTFITSFPGVINAEIVPLVRDRCFSDSCQAAAVGLHAFTRQKASTF